MDLPNLISCGKCFDAISPSTFSIYIHLSNFWHSEWGGSKKVDGAAADIPSPETGCVFIVLQTVLQVLQIWI